MTNLAVKIAALATALLCAVALAPGANAEGYYQSTRANCTKWTGYHGSAATQTLVREPDWLCTEGMRNSFYADRGGAPDYSRELFYYVPYWTAGAADSYKRSFLIEIQPGVSYRYTRGSWMARAIEETAGAFNTLPSRSWSDAKRAPPFLPTWWSTDPGHDKMLTGLTTIQGYPYPRNPLPYNARIIFFHGMTFRKHTDFVALLSAMDLSRDHFSSAHALVVYQLPGDSATEAHMALVPMVPVNQFAGSFANAIADPVVSTFALGDIGVLARMMAPFATAYNLYNASGLPEERRQECARKRAAAIPAAGLPSYC